MSRKTPFAEWRASALFSLAAGLAAKDRLGKNGVDPSHEVGEKGLSGNELVAEFSIELFSKK